jgi:hypothetical protein
MVKEKQKPVEFGHGLVLSIRRGLDRLAFMRKTLLILLIGLCCTGTGQILAQEVTPSADDGVYQITSPTDSGQLFGLVEIIGSASHPSLFQSYTLEWSNAQNPVWLPIQQPISQQVTNGLLGQWDTVAGGIPDGIYQIRLRVALTDGSEQEVVVRNLVLSNAAPTPQPTVAQPIIPTNAPEQSGSSLIEQPPGATPLPTFEPPRFEPASSDGGEEVFVTFSSAQGAICNGVLFSLALFGVVIVYLLIRGQLSPYTRRLWWQIRSEIEDQRDY